MQEATTAPAVEFKGPCGTTQYFNGQPYQGRGLTKQARQNFSKY